MPVLTVPEKIKYILARLNSFGYEAYLVGGCVRDFIMGREPSDYDVATSAMPDEIMRCFDENTVIPTGLKHGTVTVLSDGEGIEITTYRTEGKYSDNRHPDSVSFTGSLTDDLSRRDFCMNAIAMDAKMNITDPFGGESDIMMKRISCVGEPERRFNEDGLRILRCVRFASVLGFEPDEKCKSAVKRCAHLLKNISEERIFAELKKLICGKNAGTVLAEYPEVVFEIMPELRGTDYARNIECAAAEEKDLPIRLALAFGELDTDTALSILTRLKSDKKTISAVKLLLDCRRENPPNSRAEIKKLMAALGKDGFYMALNYLEKYRGEDFSRQRHTADDILGTGECISLREMKANGNDAAALGLRGEQIGMALDAAFEAVLGGVIPNEKEKIIEYIRQNSVCRGSETGGSR